MAAIIAGTKTTTGLLASKNWSVVIDSAGSLVTLIEVNKVRVVRAGDIGLAHALGEGEGYTSVAEWRSGHERFWHSREYRGAREADANRTQLPTGSPLAMGRPPQAHDSAFGKSPGEQPPQELHPCGTAAWAQAATACRT